VPRPSPLFARLGLLVKSGVGGIERDKVASRARRGPEAALAAGLPGKIAVELVTGPLTAKVDALVFGGETGPAASIKIDAERCGMMIGAAGVKPDKLTPLPLTAGQQAIEDRRQARQRRAIDRGELIWWRDDWESIGATSQSLRLAVPADRRYKLPVLQTGRLLPIAESPSAVAGFSALRSAFGNLFALISRLVLADSSV
jgi:hypothetical protein